MTSVLGTGFVRTGLVAVALAALLGGHRDAQGQLRASYSEGQDVSPAFEGWIANEDGSFDIVFGYMNRNWEEELLIPVGPDNHFALVGVGELNELEVDRYEASSADQGQPTYFLPRRNRFTFNVRVPAEFAASGQELVWTLKANGSTDRAYGSLGRDYMIDNIVIMSETGALGAGTSDADIRANEFPVIEMLDGGRVRSARVNEPVTLRARVTDDGQPPRRGFRGATAPDPDTPSLKLLERALSYPDGNTVAKAVGLHFAWFVYRGDGQNVVFDPPQIKTWEDTRAFANSPWAPFWVPPEVPEDDLLTAEVTFLEPGTYVLRGRADDGGLFSDEEIIFEVTDSVFP